MLFFPSSINNIIMIIVSAAYPLIGRYNIRKKKRTRCYHIILFFFFLPSFRPVGKNARSSSDKSNRFILRGAFGSRQRYLLAGNVRAEQIFKYPIFRTCGHCPPETPLYNERVSIVLRGVDPGYVLSSKDFCGVCPGKWVWSRVETFYLWQKKKKHRSKQLLLASPGLLWYFFFQYSFTSQTIIMFGSFDFGTNNSVCVLRRFFFC